ncbi:MAG: hypothetical protein AABX52_02855 [Nanoarchaeota archaeon]
MNTITLSTILILVILLFSIACKIQTSSAQQTMQAVPLTPSLSIPPQPQLIISTDSQPLSALFNRTITLADQKIKSYEFYYSPPPDNLARDRYYIKGNRIRIFKYATNVVQHRDYYDNVYIDTTTKTAIGLCQSQDARCKDHNKRFNLSYETAMIKLPYQWLKEITTGNISGSESLFDRTTKKIMYTKNGIQYSQWIDEYSGLPLRILVEEPNKSAYKYEFKDLAINSVLDEQMILPNEI